MPSLQPRKFESRLQEERSRYLVAELLCSVRNHPIFSPIRKRVNLIRKTLRIGRFPSGLTSNRLRLLSIFSDS